MLVRLDLALTAEAAALLVTDEGVAENREDTEWPSSYIYAQEMTKPKSWELLWCYP